MAMAIAGSPKTIDAPRQPTAAMQGHADRARRRPCPTLPPAMWALIAKPRRSGGNCSASRPLPTGCCGDPPIRDAMFGMANVSEARRERLRREPAAEQDPADAPAASAARRPGSGPRSSSWTSPEAKAPDGGEERDRLDADPELVDDREEDQRQDHRLGVVDRVGDREQAERAHRPDVDGVTWRPSAPPAAEGADRLRILPHRRPERGGPPRPSRSRG